MSLALSTRNLRAARRCFKIAREETDHAEKEWWTTKAAYFWSEANRYARHAELNAEFERKLSAELAA